MADISDQSIKILFGNFGIDYYNVKTVDTMGNIRQEGNYDEQIKDPNKHQFKNAGELSAKNFFDPKYLEYPCNPENKAYYDFNGKFYNELNTIFNDYSILSGTEICQNQIGNFTNRITFQQEYALPIERYPDIEFTNPQSKKVKAYLLKEFNIGDRYKITLDFDHDNKVLREIYRINFRGKVPSLLDNRVIKPPLDGNAFIMVMHIKDVLTGKILPPVLLINIHYKLKKDSPIRGFEDFINILNGISYNNIILCGDFNLNAFKHYDRKNNIENMKYFVTSKLSNYKRYNLDTLYNYKEECNKQGINQNMLLFYKLPDYNINLDLGIIDKCDRYYSTSSHVLIPIKLKLKPKSDGDDGFFGNIIKWIFDKPVLKKELPQIPSTVLKPSKNVVPQRPPRRDLGETDFRQPPTSQTAGGMAQNKYVTYKKRKFGYKDALQFINNMGLDMKKEKFTVDDVIKGLNVELEHGTVDPKTNVSENDLMVTGKIALAHLREFPDYYRRLEQMEKAGDAYWEKRSKTNY